MKNFFPGDVIEAFMFGGGGDACIVISTMDTDSFDRMFDRKIPSQPGFWLLVSSDQKTGFVHIAVGGEWRWIKQ